MKRNLFFCLMMLIMAILPSANAQEGKIKKPVERYWYINADGGLSVNHGDIANYEGWMFEDFNTDFILHNFDGKVGLGYQFGGVFGTNAKFGTGTLSGYKEGQMLSVIDGPQGLYGLAQGNTRDTRTSYMEGSLNFTFNVFNMFNYNPRRVVNLVPHVGIGGIWYKAGSVVMAHTGETVAEKKESHDHTYFVPVGAEVNFNVAPKLDIYLDYTYNFAGKDNLDQVVKYPKDDIQVINDMYSQVNLGLRFKFNTPCDIERMARDSKDITIKANPDPLAEKDGKVCFDVIVTVPERYFEKMAVANLTPYVTYEWGQIELEPIILAGEKVKGAADFVIDYENGGKYSKHYCIDYVPEIENSELWATPVFYVYREDIYENQEDIVKNTYFTQGTGRKLADGVTVTTKPAEPEPETVAEEPAPEPAPDFIYYFGKDRSAIMETELTRACRNALGGKIQEGGVTGFRIEAWASPEGEEDHNSELSSRRADAAMNDIDSHVEGEYEFICNSNGPDWEMFAELVRNSDIADKDAIVSNIENSGDKEQTIREMIQIYPEMESSILPLLRRAEVYAY